MSLSLYRKNPKRKDIVVLIGAALLFLTVGLSLPIMSVQKLLIWKENFSIWQGITALFKDGSYFLALLIFFFSILFPYAKLTLLSYIWFGKTRQDERKDGMRWLKVLAKWSMLDVFVVAILIVMNKTGGPIEVSPRAGIYFFAISIMLSIYTSWAIDRVVKS